MQGKWEPNGQWKIEAAAPPLSPHQRLESYFSTGLSKSGRWHFRHGASLFLLGLISIWSALAAFQAPPISLEALLILAGAVAFVSALGAGRISGSALPLALALIPLATGAYLLGTPRPPDGPALALAAYFIASGMATILLAAGHRRRPLRHWEWLTVSGVASLILALLLLAGLPGPYTWMLGLLLGVHFMFGGSAFLALALADDAF